ncbi:deaminase [Paenalcaligenes faecalis]|uniref:deaminase n=1 Tax=Paenalcaligenes faecalis TaxID=2980099 RepID=UPI0022B9C0B6|nr:deaminase [Paenalcaligenes faecalis]
MNNINKIYEDLREGFIVVGLTGSIGSGCSKVAQILESNLGVDDVSFFEKNILSKKDINHKFDSLELYRCRKIKFFLKDKKWRSFFSIKVSNLIFALLFSCRDSYNSNRLNVRKWFNGDFFSTEDLCSKIVNEINRDDGCRNNEDGFLTNLLIELDLLISKNIDKSKIEYTDDFQNIGLNLRKNGVLIENFPVFLSKDVSNVFNISGFINKLIKKLRKEGHKFFVVDALRNIHEINFFKSRYSNFYLFAIQAEEEIREKRVLDGFGFLKGDYEKIKKIETDSENIYSQNINECLSMGDVFINNNYNNIDEIKYNLIKYISLIRSPGLFTPSVDERNMQIALTARYNSGCISRQVGACIVSENGFVLGIGWNDVPVGSIPCLYRSSRSLLTENNVAPEFSNYELSIGFKDYISESIGSKGTPFCFKDIENRRYGEEKLKELKDDFDTFDRVKDKILKNIKNPTRERALHAEENAFLQARINSYTLKNSTLYTTASPCQLCAKKSRQLEVKRIVYIDAYPDISNSQTLMSGDLESRPLIESFQGVAESAFMKLFKPLMNIKEEIKLKEI